MSNQPQNQAHEVFVSYSHKDTAICKWLVSILRNEFNVSAWYDNHRKEGLHAGAWENQLEEKLLACKLVLFIVTAAFGESKPCKEEYNYGKRKGKVLLPVQFDEACDPDNFTGFGLEFGRLNRILFFKGPEDEKLKELHRWLVNGSVNCEDLVDFTALPKFQRRTTIVEPPAVLESDTVAKNSPTQTEVSEITTANCDLSIPVLTVEDAVLRELLCSACKSIGEAGDTFPRASRREMWEQADRSLGTTITFETLRDALLCHLSACISSRGAAAHAAPSISAILAIAASPGLRAEHRLPDEDAWSAFASVERLVRDACASESVERVEGVSVTDFIESEREAAKVLANYGGVPVRTATGVYPVAFGPYFASRYGAKSNLLGAAAAIRDLRSCHYFTPLRHTAFMFRAGRHEELIDHPPNVLAHSEWFPHAARFVTQAVEAFLSQYLNPGVSRALLVKCEHAWTTGTRFHQGLAAEDLLRHKSCVAGLLRNLMMQTNTQSKVERSDLEILRSVVINMGMAAGVDQESLNGFLDNWRHLAARLYATVNDWAGVLPPIEEIVGAGGKLSDAEVQWRFMGWLRRFWRKEADALVKMRECHAVLVERKVSPAFVGAIEAQLREAERIENWMPAVADFETACADYDREASPVHSVALNLAVRRRAQEMMGAGRDGVEIRAFLQEQSRRFPACAGLEKLHLDLAQEWAGSFPALSLGKLIGSPGASKHDTISQTAVVESGTVSSAFTNALNVLMDARRDAERIMKNDGPVACANFVNKMRQLHPEMNGIANLHLELQREWLHSDAFGAEALMRFASLSSSIPLSPPVVRVSEPERLSTPAPLHTVATETERNEVQKRLDEYRKFSQP